ncbi:MAG: dihydroorotase [Crocinitomicaceae bacterium]|jgi:dihydroorotase|nr:dihydroorotase [Crocinitomicaceae bacterium]
MKVILKNAVIVDPNSEWNSKKADILISDGVIEKIAKSISDQSAQVVKATNLHVSPGWFDMHVNFRDPGEEYKENLDSGIAAAIAGGFTGVALMPSTTPPISNKAMVDYVVNRAKHTPIDVLPCGTVSSDRKGLQLSEMYDMKLAGAVAFTDDKASIRNSGLLSRALLYAKNFNGTIMSFPFDQTAQVGGMMNEGVTSTMLGIEGIPNVAEELQITRDLYLTEYNDAKIHFSTISSPRGLDLIAEAKESGLAVSCDIAIHNLLLNDETITSFDPNFKVLPPLRSEEDRLELIEGLKDGTIDVICSDHSPEDVEHKALEFGAANYGIIGLETLFGLAITNLSGVLTLDEIINKISINPRTILQLDIPIVKEGFEANLTLFDPGLEWTYQTANSKSKAKNTPFEGCELIGKAIGIYNKKQLEMIDA